MVWADQTAVHCLRPVCTCCWNILDPPGQSEGNVAQSDVVNCPSSRSITIGGQDNLCALCGKLLFICVFLRKNWCVAAKPNSEAKRKALFSMGQEDQKMSLVTVCSPPTPVPMVLRDVGSSCPSNALSLDVEHVYVTSQVNCISLTAIVKAQPVEWYMLGVVAECSEIDLKLSFALGTTTVLEMVRGSQVLQFRSNSGAARIICKRIRGIPEQQSISV